MDKSFTARVTVELIGEDSKAVYHRVVAEDMTLDVAETGIYMSVVPKAILDSLVAANAQMFKA